MLAVWVDSRFPRIAPGDLRIAVLHLGAGLVANSIAAPAVARAIASTGLPGTHLFVVICIALPALVYVALAAFWIVKQLRDPLSSITR